MIVVTTVSNPVVPQLCVGCGEPAVQPVEVVDVEFNLRVPIAGGTRISSTGTSGWGVTGSRTIVSVKYAEHKIAAKMPICTVCLDEFELREKLDDRAAAAGGKLGLLVAVLVTLGAIFMLIYRADMLPSAWAEHYIALPALSFLVFLLTPAISMRAFLNRKYRKAYPADPLNRRGIVCSIRTIVGTSRGLSALLGANMMRYYFRSVRFGEAFKASNGPILVKDPRPDAAFNVKYPLLLNKKTMQGGEIPLSKA